MKVLKRAVATSLPAKKVAAKKAPAKKAVKAPDFQYDALSYRQRDAVAAPTFVVFHAPASEIMKWADVDRLSDENPQGAQRVLQRIKVGKVAKFLSNPANTIPTAVVIALDSDFAHFVPAGKAPRSAGTFEISLTPDDGKPGLIIDGQHRVFGVAQHAADTQLNVVAFLGGDDAERAFQFVVINNSAAKVSKDHVRALNLKYDPVKLNARLVTSAGVSLGMSDEKYEDLSLLDGSPPFKGLIEWPTNRDGFIAANALEGALTETKDRAALLGIEGLEMDVFLQIWTKISKVRKSLWKPFPESRLLMKVSIYALTVFILDTMVARLRMQDTPVDFTDVKTLDVMVERIVTRIPEEFWTTEWRSKELDTTAGRKIVLEALGVVESNARYKRVWYENVSIVDPALVHGQTYAAPKKRVVAKKAVR